MTWVGADTEQLRAVASTCDQTRAELEELIARCVQVATQLQWSGPDAEGFRERVASTETTVARALLGAMQAAAERLRLDASAQDEVSATLNPVVLGFNGPDGGGAPLDSWGFLRPWLPDFGSGSFSDLFSGGLDWVQERSGNAETLKEIFGNMDDLGAPAGLESLFEVSKEVGVGNALGALSFGVDVFQWTDRWDEQSGLQTAWDGVGLAIDGIGVAVPQVGLAKGAWDIGFGIGTSLGTYLDDRFDTSGAFLDSVYARTGEYPTYEGVGGVIDYFTDSVENVFSAKAWGF